MARRRSRVIVIRTERKTEDTSKNKDFRARSALERIERRKGVKTEQKAAFERQLGKQPERPAQAGEATPTPAVEETPQPQPQQEVLLTPAPPAPITPAEEVRQQSLPPRFRDLPPEIVSERISRERVGVAPPELRAAPKPTVGEKARQRFERSRQRVRRGEASTAEAVGTGFAGVGLTFGAPVIETVSLGQQAVRAPKETAKGLGQAIRSPRETARAFTAQTGTGIRQADPIALGGIVSAPFAAAKAPGVIGAAQRSIAVGRTAKAAQASVVTTRRFTTSRPTGGQQILDVSQIKGGISLGGLKDVKVVGTATRFTGVKEGKIRGEGMTSVALVGREGQVLGGIGEVTKSVGKVGKRQTEIGSVGFQSRQLIGGKVNLADPKKFAEAAETTRILNIQTFERGKSIGQRLTQEQSATVAFGRGVVRPGLRPQKRVGVIETRTNKVLERTDPGFKEEILVSVGAGGVGAKGREALIRLRQAAPEPGTAKRILTDKKGQLQIKTLKPVKTRIVSDPRITTPSGRLKGLAGELAGDIARTRFKPSKVRFAPVAGVAGVGRTVISAPVSKLAPPGRITVNQPKAGLIPPAVIPKQVSKSFQERTLNRIAPALFPPITKQVPKITPKPPSGAPFLFPSTPKLPPVSLPPFLPFGGLFGNGRGLTGKRTQRQPKFTPSLTAAGFGITGKELKGVLSGFELRPLTKKRRKKK